MEHYIFYCKLSLLAVLSLITACCMLSRRWYVNLVAFLACLSGETFLAHLFFPGYMLCPAAASFIILFLSRIWDLSRTPAKGNGADPIRLPVRSGIRESRLEFYYHYSNFLVYGGAGSGKTKSIGKWLLSEYMRLGFAGFIYDFKDTDYTRTAYNLIKRHRYPHKFYYVSFDRPERSYRFNPLKVVRDRTELIQLMEDVLLALLPKKEQQNEWVAGGLGILRGVAFRFWDEFPEHCTLPHILAFIMTASARQLSLFLQQNLVSEMLAGAYLKAEGSEKTQASYLSTLCNNLATVSQNEEIAYVLSGDDFDFNLIDPENPKLFAISNNFSKNSVYAPVIGMLMTISSRQFTMRNKVPFVYFLDEMTTVNIKNFETLPSVLREYLCAFVLLTQSGSKVEKPVWQARPFIRGSQLREPVFRTDQRRGVIEILSHDVRKGGKGTEIPQRGKKRGKHEQERDRIVPERGHLSGKGFCGSGTRGVHRFRHACQRQLLQGKAGDV